MIITKKISADYYDVTHATTGKALGSIACGHDKVFQWHAFLNSAPVLNAALLRAIADFIDSINTEATRPSNETNTTATD